MKSRLVLITSFLIVFSANILAQNNEVIPLKDELIVETNTTVRDSLDPLTPSRAAFYSAILPGLGQAYNKKYWKIPLVYAALGTGIYFYIDNTKEYNRYRDAYKSRLAGRNTDEFWGTDVNNNPFATPQISNDALIRAQEALNKNREISLLVTIGIYALNIIDANVDAHLLQYNVDENLALKPHFKMNELDATTNLGLTLNFNF
ncbi:MAG: DUF5683 domain-containing protein [Melioribacteraceae bacterium]|nr:DUF5683 domain-containing protein [Melioribacteraceae bacterium]